MADAPRERGRQRLVLLGLLVASLVLAIALLSAWVMLRGWPYLTWQKMRAGGDVGFVQDRALEFHKAYGHYPRDLDSCGLTSVDAMRPDVWGRLPDYRLSDNGFSVCWYGRDGQPGGVGLDCDLCADESNPGSVTGWRACDLTLRQFVFELDAARRIVWACVASALLAAVLFMVLAFRRYPSALGFEPFLTTLVYSLIVAAALVFHTTPMGH